VLRVDGGMKSARDVVIAALLGAEEYDFGTSALVALGCVMARQCHLNTCPVGIATQDKELRKRFNSSPDRLVNFINFVAEEVRRLLASMGYVALDEVIGKNELLQRSGKYDSIRFAERIDLAFLFETVSTVPYYFNAKLKFRPQPAKEEVCLDDTAIEEVRPAVMAHGRAIVTRKLKNTDRAVGSRLSGLISFLYGPSEFKGHIQYRLNGAAGQSLGAFLVDNVELRLCGVANDYVGKGMSGGLITIRFPKEIRKSLEGNTIIGNVALYGATGGELLVAGRAGERFAVRNSGAAAVVEGVGNHCCEYMTRGLVIVLGDTGQNFGSGMTGGSAFIYDIHGTAESKLNDEYVRISSIEATDEDLLLKYLVNHKFHTGSTIAAAIHDNWDIERYRFVKIVPRALDVVDLQLIYEEQYKNRLMEVFNE
ncbi:MAG: glutamate synthase subunit alpha, partial [Ignavibacteriales bacterium]|nr:glutamate synthase subunit alpha [Ignavibacteriales bacterium]